MQSRRSARCVPDAVWNHLIIFVARRAAQMWLLMGWAVMGRALMPLMGPPGPLWARPLWAGPLCAPWARMAPPLNSTNSIDFQSWFASGLMHLFIFDTVQGSSRRAEGPRVVCQMRFTIISSFS